MGIVTWNARFETGIPLIDDQHRALFEALNRLAEAFGEGRSREEAQASLRFLVDYTVEHFEAEERVMAEAGYPGLQGHRAEHARLMDSVQDMVSKANRGEAITMAVAILFSEWLQSHIYGTDLRYAEFIRNRLPGSLRG